MLKHAPFLNITRPIRLFHSSTRSAAKYYDVVVPKSEANKPIPFPSSVQLTVHPIPIGVLPQQSPHGRFSYQQLTQHKESLRVFRESSVYYKEMSQETAVLEIRGPLGVGYVTIPEWLDLRVSSDINAFDNGESVDIWHGQQNPMMGQLESPTFSTSKLIPAANNDQERILHVSCVDPEHRLQERMWGFYRRRIAHYIRTTSEPNVIPIRLVGVGYRASIESLSIKGPEKGDYKAFQGFVMRWQNLIKKSPLRMYLAEKFPDSFWGQAYALRRLLNHDVSKHFTQVFPETLDKPLPVPLESLQKLVLKLGFSHNVEVIIPPFIQVAIPNPARVLLSGLHTNKIREFALNVRKWRAPEPYKGKGVFVGNETITLKSKKVK